ncbi:DUF21 domain-containing protein [candidate division WOR-3 bacterium]|nr:DUF21 domain-containing protein [candidate division WOR-3 bacterium]
MLYLIFCAILLFLSASFSASETAIFSLPSYAVNSCRNSGFRGKALQKLYNKPNFTLPLLLFSNTVVNVILSVLAFKILLSLMGKTAGDAIAVLINITVVTSLLLIFGEFGPKLLAIRRTLPIALAISPYIYFLSFTLYPFIKPLELFLLMVLKNRQNEILAPSEVMYLLHKVRNSERNSVKWKLTYSLIALGQTEAKDIMRTRHQIPFLEKFSTWKEAKALFEETTVKTALVFDKNFDDIAGTLSLSKCIAQGLKDSDRMDKYLDSVVFVPKSAKLTKIIDDLKNVGDVFLVVKDEYGQTAGIVTEDDILGYLLGDKSHKRKNSKPHQRGSGIDAECTLRELSESLGFYLDPEISDMTVGKYILENIKTMPSKKDRVRLGDWIIRVEEVKKNKVLKVSVFKDK